MVQFLGMRYKKHVACMKICIQNIGWKTTKERLHLVVARVILELTVEKYIFEDVKWQG
jgi:hypothetical protein